VFRKTVEARLGRGRGAVVLDHDLLERNGIAGTGPLARVKFERWLAGQGLDALRAGAGEAQRWTRLPVFVVGALEEPLTRRAGLALPERVFAALGRIPLPRGVEPLPVAIWMLPERWTPLQGAELFAWLKEFSAALAAAGEGLAAGRGYALNLVLGRSDVHDEGSGAVLNYTDQALALRAAEFVAACHTGRTLDWALAAGRGVHRQGRFHSLGIAPLAPESLGDGRGALERALERSRVLWPTAVPARTHSEWVGCAVIGARRDDPLPESLDGWNRVAPIEGGASPPGCWLCRLAFGLEPRDLLGAEDWRRHYSGMPSRHRGGLHAEAARAELPDPLGRPSIVESKSDAEQAPFLLP
jgi:hypothetical protein